MEAYAATILGIKLSSPLKPFELVLEWLYNRKSFRLQAGKVRVVSKETRYGYNLPRLLELEQQTHSAAIEYGTGEYYSKGLGIAQDQAKAIKWHRRAAEQGNAVAQSNQGLLYENGYGVPKNLDAAISLYSQAATSDNTEAFVA